MQRWKGEKHADKIEHLIYDKLMFIEEISKAETCNRKLTRSSVKTTEVRAK
ncbi:hypothetical protein C1H46_045834 [Malus baccata]|uniref:Uncharacterized protein n=1 Tax=Malus baccata TaxID=106549 RepID=A0A540K2Y8_MALBA|nr:hypothetical protein C1H46_045834 [Malus baccata]